MHSLPGDLLVAQPFEAVLFLSFLQMDKTTQLDRLYYYFSVSSRAATISFDGWGSQSWLQPAFQPAFRGGCAASQGRLKSRLQAELPGRIACPTLLRQSRAVLQSQVEVT